MDYAKLALTFEQQADQLIQRGLECDRDELISRLTSVSYYRLSGYWFPFRRSDDHFVPGTDLRMVWRRYTFDRRFRVLVLDAIERVEICVRTELVYRLAHLQGPFGYLEPANLPNLSEARYVKFIECLSTEYERSSEPFIKHFKAVYGDRHCLPPYWMVAELMTFGTLLTLYRGCPNEVRRQISSRFGVPVAVFDSWLSTLNVVRNICAHHGRLWNRVLGVKPKIPKKDVRWQAPVVVQNDRVFAVLSMLLHLLACVAPQSGWRARFEGLRGEYPEIPLVQMGFPEGWERCPIWE